VILKYRGNMKNKVEVCLSRDSIVRMAVLFGLTEKDIVKEMTGKIEKEIKQIIDSITKDEIDSILHFKQ
jgi:hypothetical protein